MTWLWLAGKTTPSPLLRAPAGGCRCKWQACTLGYPPSALLQPSLHASAFLTDILLSSNGPFDAESRHRKCPGCGISFGQGDVHNFYFT